MRHSKRARAGAGAAWFALLLGASSAVTVGCSSDPGKIGWNWDAAQSWFARTLHETARVAPRRDSSPATRTDPILAPAALALAPSDYRASRDARESSSSGGNLGARVAERIPARIEPSLRVRAGLPDDVSALHAPGADEGPGAPDEDAETSPRLVATAKVTNIYARPSSKARKLGYLRTGAVVTRGLQMAGRDGCPGGFYPVTPEGFVCVGSGASLDTQHELARAGIRRADRSATMPYTYGMAEGGGVPFYSRVPTVSEQTAAEPEFVARRARAGTAVASGGVDALAGFVASDPVPWFLEGGASSIGTNGLRFSRESPVLRRGIPKSGFAFVSLFTSGAESDHRRFGLTVDMTVVPLDRFRRVEPSAFHGIPLVDATLPVVFVRTRGASLYEGDPATGLRVSRRLEYREGIAITGRTVRAQGASYLETRGGGYIVDQGLVRIDPLPALPSWSASGRTWIDVSIDRQTLVAYEGTRPVFATLVSTGKDGTGDPTTTHSTIQGEFAIHTKHVTATMDGDEVGDEFDLRDVPYVQYFKDGFALHAAYWHDGFGTPRSHGCVNLSPLDARWLFSFTEPHVPMAWHGAMSAHGTLISVHP